LEKPDFIIVYKYAQRQISYYISKFASKHPPEHQQEMAQDALERVWKAYQKFDRPDWKGFIQNHCRGAILDYIKMGRGFAEDNLTIKNPKPEVLQKYPHMLRYRQYPGNTITDDEQVVENDPEIVVAKYYEIMAKREPEKVDIVISWDVVAFMSAIDRDLHITAKLLLGFKLTELADIFGVRREHISQRFNAFIKRLDDPKFIGDPWVENIIWALGLNEIYGVVERPRMITFHVEQIDLWYTGKIKPRKVPIQLSFKF